MKLKSFATACIVALAAIAARGQSAALVANVNVIAPGGMGMLSAAVTYPGQPGAVGWSVTLPEGWSYVATNGPDAPQVRPQSGATGTLEWAYADVPATGARFSFAVKAGDKPGEVVLSAKVFVRADGQQRQIDVAPVSFAVAR